MHHEPAHAHGGDEITLAAEQLSGAGDADKQGLMHKQRVQGLRRRVAKIEPTGRA